MNFAAALLAFATTAAATGVMTDALAQHSITGLDVTYDGYFNYEAYRPRDYGLQDVIDFPDPDFNKQVYQFDESEDIFDEEDYACRVRVEAHMLVALEALKEEVRWLHEDVDSLMSSLESEDSYCPDLAEDTAIQLQRIRAQQSDCEEVALHVRYTFQACEDAEHDM